MIGRNDLVEEAEKAPSDTVVLSVQGPSEPRKFAEKDGVECNVKMLCFERLEVRVEEG